MKPLICWKNRSNFCLWVGCIFVGCSRYLSKFTRLGRTVFTTLDHHLFASMLGSTEKPSVFIVISNSGTNKEASTLADLAKQQGIPIISITQDEKSVIGEKVISSSKPLVGKTCH